MTTHSLFTFLRHTPNVSTCLFTHSPEVRDRVLAALPADQRYRVASRVVPPEPMLAAPWNPTQYKLALASLHDAGFECIFWMDSDTIVFGDMTNFLLTFERSTKLAYLVEDHFMRDDHAVRLWLETHPDAGEAGFLVPQACLMGFRVSCIVPLFNRWRQRWNEWITPHAFAKRRDPRPHFSGSAFCIEQYALGEALHDYMLSVHRDQGGAPTAFRLLDHIQLFERETIVVQDHELPQEPNVGETWPFNQQQRDFLGSPPPQPAEVPANTSLPAALRRLRLGETSFTMAGMVPPPAVTAGDTSLPSSFAGLVTASFPGLAPGAVARSYPEIGQVTTSFAGVPSAGVTTSFAGFPTTSFAGFGPGVTTSFAGEVTTSFAGWPGLETTGSSAGLSWPQLGLVGSSAGISSAAISWGSLALSWTSLGPSWSSLVLPESLHTDAIAPQLPRGFIVLDRFGKGATSEPSVYHTYHEFYDRARAWLEKQEK